ncbi:hypothetical protein DOCECA_15610 [Pseudomonas sp. E102]
MSRVGPWLIAAGAAALLAVAWWGWRQGGLVLMQLGMGSC